MEQDNDVFSLLREIGESSNDGLLIYDYVEGKVCYTNSAASRLVGLAEEDAEEEIKARFVDVRFEDKSYLQDRFARLNDTANIPAAEFRIRIGNERERTLSFNSHFVSNRSYLVIFISDVTLAREHQEYLLEFGTKKNTLLEMLTHHISGALTLMQHLSAEARKSMVTNDHKNMEEYLSLVSQNSKMCLQVIADLLQNEKAKGSEISVRNIRLDVVEKIRFIFEEVSQSFKSRNFHYAHPLEPVFIMVDELKMLQVVNILVSNAIKFTRAADPIIFTVSLDTTQIIVSVADKGIGIPESLKPFIFDRQGAAGRAGLNGEKSSGFGLSICKYFVELMGGRLWFTSIESVGSEFFFSLPLKAA